MISYINVGLYDSKASKNTCTVHVDALSGNIFISLESMTNIRVSF